MVSRARSFLQFSWDWNGACAENHLCLRANWNLPVFPTFKGSDRILASSESFRTFQQQACLKPGAFGQTTWSANWVPQYSAQPDRYEPNRKNKRFWCTTQSVSHCYISSILSIYRGQEVAGKFILPHREHLRRICRNAGILVLTEPAVTTIFWWALAGILISGQPLMTRILHSTSWHHS